ncbi:MAG TPA: oxygen-independent coproporphyrinogen III oxidase [Hypericibacter adhaerens]|uniref:oxygen-independent coproporphyrinogen III oxidase n=1 Tax=Hypericibacter adhaerens TaxID=2602016 RepID=UPI002C17C43C|nr:oxygen-independent coproporphyrinogen III oxidase [Hypericibacter adhaerens]HWA44904.1 oxygen-independent coproporphyrinogen III oxidase [Hypericibacter adhaerens]
MKDSIRARYAEERLPRYTSYPTAPHFTGAVSARRYDKWLASLPAAPASLYLHIPFCRSMCWYCGCHTTVARRDRPILDYLAALRREIELVADRLTQPLPVRQIHFGGGTPTILAPVDFAGLVRLLRQRFPLERDAEIAVEIDPRTLAPAMIGAFGEAGVTRANLGVQSFDVQVQEAINRRQGFEQTAAAVTALRAAGIDSIGFDLIYGLPHQTVRSCLETVEACVALRPGRIAVFGYAHLPGFKKHQRKIDEAALPGGSARHDQAEAIAEALMAAGYRRIGIDHFALPGDRLAEASAKGALHRNFQGYTTDSAETLIGFGASAIGRLPQGYVQNETVLGAYAERVQRGELATARGYRLTAEDRLRGELIERLMCDFEVDVAAICARHGAAPAELMRSANRLEALAADGIVQVEGSVVRLADDSHFLARTVASAFDAHLGARPGGFSRAV